MPVASNDPRLGGGNYTLEDLQRPENAGVLQARKDAVDMGFSGDFGGGRYRTWLEGMQTGQQANTAPAPAPAPAPIPAPVAASPTAQDIAQQIPSYLDYGAIASRVNVPQVDYSQISGLMAPSFTGLEYGQGALATGQAALGAGQEGLATGQATLGTGQQDILTGQEALALGVGQGQQELAGGQLGLMMGQQNLGQQVGGVQTGVTGLELAGGQAATDQVPATGLYAGQAGLATGQQQLGTRIGRDISGVGADISAFQRAVEEYQRAAQGQRGDIQAAGLAGREQLQRQVGDVGIQANRAAEQMAAARQQMMATPRGAAMMAAGVAPGGIPQQAAQFAQMARQQPMQQVPGQQATTLGPGAIDPRIALARGLMREQ